MPSIYPPKISEVYDTSTYIPSSLSTVVISETPTVESVLVSYISGFTTWAPPPASIENISAQSIIVHNKFYTSSLFTDYLSAGTIYYTIGDYKTISANTLSTNTLQTNFLTLNIINTQSTIASSIYTNVFVTSSLQGQNIYTSSSIVNGDFITNFLITDILSTTNVSSEKAFLSSIVADNIISQNLFGSNIQLNNLNVSRIIRTNALTADTISTSQVTSRLISANGVYVSTINGLIYPQPIDAIQNLVVSSLSANSRFQTSSLTTKYLSTVELSTGAIYVSSIRFNELSTYQLDIKSVSFPFLQTDLFSTNNTEGNSILSQSTFANAVSTSTLSSSSYIQGVSTTAKFISSSQISGNYFSTSFVGLESLSSFSLRSQVDTISSLDSLRFSTASFVGYSLTADSLTTSSISTQVHNTSSLQFRNFNANRINTLTTQGGAFEGSFAIGSSTQSQNFFTNEAITSSLVANSIYTSDFQIAISGKTKTLDVYTLSADQITANNAYFSTFNSLEVSTSTFKGNSAIIQNIYTDAISTTTVKSQEIIANSVNVSEISTQLMELNQLSTSQVYANYISSSQISGFSLKVDDLKTSSLTTNAFLGSSIVTTTILADYISTFKLYTSDIQIAQPVANFLSTNAIEVYEANIKSLAAGYIAAESTTTNTMQASTIIVGEFVDAPSTIASFTSTSQTFSGYGSTQNLIISSINGQQYPPPFIVQPDITISTILAHSTITTNELITNYLSVGLITVDSFSSDFSQINTLSSSVAYLQNGFISSLSANTISTTILKAPIVTNISYTEDPESFISSLNTKVLNATNVSVSTLSTSILKSEFMEGLQIDATQVSTIYSQIPSIFVSSFQTYLLTADALTAKEGIFSRLQLSNISTNHLQANTGYVSTIETTVLSSENLFGLNNSATSTFSEIISTETFVGQVAEGNQWYATTISLSSLQGLQGTFINLSTNTVSTSVLQGGQVVLSSLQANILSSQISFVDVATVSSLNATNIQANNLFTNLISSSSLSTNVLQTGLQIADELSLQTINTDFLSTGKLDATRFNARVTNAENLFIDQVYLPNTNIYSLSTNNVSSGTAIVGVAVAPSLFFSTISTGIIETQQLSTSLLNVQNNSYVNNLYTNTISSFGIYTHSISTYTAEIYGAQTLFVQGQTIFAGPVYTTATFSISSLDVETLTVTSNVTGTSATYVSSFISSISSSVFQGRTLTTSSLTTNYLSSVYVSSKTLAVQGIQARDFVNTKVLSGGEATASSISFQYINQVSSLNQIPQISSFQIESGRLKTQSMSSLFINTSSISTGTQFLSSLYIQNLSSGSLIGNWNYVNVSSFQTNILSSGTGVASFGLFSTLQFATVSSATLKTDAIVATSLFADSLSTTTFNFGTLTNNQIQSQSTLATTIQSSSMNISSLFGTSISTVTMMVYGQGIGTFSTINTNTLSTGSIMAGRIIISSIQAQAISSINIQAGVATARFISSQFTSSGNVFLQGGTLLMSSIYTNELTLQSVVANENSYNSLQIGTISAATVQGGPRSFADVKLLSTQSISTTRMLGNSLTLNTFSTASLSTATLLASSITASQVTTNILSTQSIFTNSILNSSFSVDSISNVNYLIQQRNPTIVTTVNTNYLNSASLFTSSATFSTINSDLISTTNMSNAGITLRFNTIQAASFTTGSVTDNNLYYNLINSDVISTANLVGGTAILGSVSTNFLSSQFPVQEKLLNTRNLFVNNISVGTLEVNDAYIYSRIFADNIIIPFASYTETENRLIINNISTNIFSTPTITVPSGGRIFMSNVFADRVSTGFIVTSSIRVFSISTIQTITSNAYFGNFRTNFISTPLDISTTLWQTSSLFTNFLSTNMLSTGQLDARQVFISDVFNIEFPQPFQNIYYNLNTNAMSVVSTNVITLTHSSSLLGSNKYVRSYMQNPSLWVTCGDDTDPNAKLKYSTDGYTWFNSSGDTFSGPAYGVSFNDQLQCWVAVGSNTNSAGTIKASTDGIFWQNSLSGGFTNRANCVASGYDSNGGPIFVAGGTSTNPGSALKYSTNGFNWIDTNFNAFSNVNSISFSGRSWVVNGDASINLLGSNYVNPSFAYSYTSNFPSFITFTGFYYQVYNGTGTTNDINNYINLPLCNGPNSFGYASNFTNITTATNNFCGFNVITALINIVWTGYIYAPVTGRYGFGMRGANKAWLWIGSNALSGWSDANDFLYSDLNTVTNTCNFIGNTIYPVRIQLIKQTDDANKAAIVFYMSNPGSPFTCNVPFASPNSLGTSISVGWNGFNFITVGSSNINAPRGGYSNNFLPSTIATANGNGTNWIQNRTGGFASRGNGVAGNERLWVTVGDGATTNQTIQYSTNNGLNWTNISANGFNTTGGRGVAWGDSAFVAVGDASSANDRIKVSTNGSNWTSATSGGFDTAAYGVAYSKLYTPNFITTGFEVLGQNQVYLSDSNTLTTPQSQTIFTAAPSTFIMGRTLMIYNQSTILIKPNATLFDKPDGYTLDIDGTLRTTNDTPIKLTTGNWGTIPSDMRLKTNIVSTNIDTCYDVVKQIPLYHYRYIDKFYKVYKVNDKGQLGFLAQDVQPYFPDAVQELPDSYFGYGSILGLNATPLLFAQYGAAQKLIQLHEERLPQFEAIKEAYESTLSQVSEDTNIHTNNIFTTYETYIHASTTMNAIERNYDQEIEAQSMKFTTLQTAYEQLKAKVSTLEAFSQSLSQPPPTTE
jgi:hypothetical protein